MLTATASGNNIILQTQTVGTFVLERNKNSAGWEAWDGTNWGGVPLPVPSGNFTDYDLEDGVYQYRYILTATPAYLPSNCELIGRDKRGWTFRNYAPPEGLYGEVLTPDDIKYTMMWGTPFLATDGQTWDDEQTRYMVESAVFQLEKALNIDIFQRSYYADDDVNENIEESKFVIKEFPHSLRRGQRYTLSLKHRPVREVTRFQLYTPQATLLLNLLPWMRDDKRNGILHFRPKQGSVTTSAGVGYHYGDYFNGRYRNYPDAYHIDYKTGYKDATFFPEDLREIVGKLTALKMLNIIGDGLLAGFSSSSLSLDGLSESFSSTQSATSATYGARIKVYADDIEKYITENRNKYGNFRKGSF